MATDQFWVDSKKWSSHKEKEDEIKSRPRL